MKKTSAKKGLTWLLIALIFCALVFVIVFSVIKIIQNPIDKVKGYLAAGDEEAVVSLYNSGQLSSGEQAQLDAVINSYITNIRQKWDKGTPEDNSKESLTVFTEINNTRLADSARRHIRYITAEEYLTNDDYKSLVEYYNETGIDPKDISLIDTEINNCISSVKENWNSRNEKYDISLEKLNYFADINNDEIKQDVSEKIQYITLKEYLKSMKLNTLADYYNKEDLYENVKAEIDSDIEAFIDELVAGWCEETFKYNEVRDRIKYFAAVSDKDIASKSVDSLNFISAENEGNAALNKAIEAYNSQKYIEAMKASARIPEKYSQSSVLKSIYSYSRDALLEDIRYPQTVDEYNKASETVNKLISEIEDSEFLKLKEQFSGEIEEYSEVYHYLNDAADFYEEGNIRDAFSRLREGQSKYPGDSKIKYALSAFQYAYIVTVTNDVIDNIENDEKDEARNLLETAGDIYECDEFKALLSELNGNTDSESSVLSDNGYIMDKTGTRLLMDTFGIDEENSILSLSGTLGSSLLNADSPLDVRSLASDMSEWGEDDYLGARLALDAVGLKSLVGALKYARSQNQNASAPAGNASMDKKMINIPEMLSDIRNKSTVVKLKSGKTNTSKNAVRYEPVITVNQSLSGRVHPLTNVKFNQKKLDYSNGSHIIGVFPKFESVYDVQLPKEYWRASSEKQMKYLSENLAETYDTLKGQKKLGKVFDSGQLRDIKEGKLPEGYIWHYNEKEGLMQIVDKEIHENTRHTEGNSLWGEILTKK